MESCIATFATLQWLPVIVSTIAAFLVGWLWYSPTMFVKKWMDGLPQPPKWQPPMWMPMVAQLFGTLLLAVVIHLSMAEGHVGFVLLISLMLIGFIKANGLYTGKTKTAISVEVGYIVVMALIMVGVNLLL